MKDYKRIIGREVDNENRTIFVIENLNGEEERVLYSDIDQKRVRMESKNNDRSIRIIKNFQGEKIVLRSHDELGNKIEESEINIRKDKFLNPKKYDKKDTKS